VQLEGKVALVTGGGAETGRAIALRLAAGGALVVVADIDLASAQATVAAIAEQGGHAAAIEADVTDDEQVRRMIAFAGRDGGGPHVLVNNAGGRGEANYPDGTPAQWSATLDLNLRAAMLATQLALEPMRAAGGGVVINIASTAGLGSAPYVSPDYGAAKAGLIRYTTTAWRAGSSCCAVASRGAFYPDKSCPTAPSPPSSRSPDRTLAAAPASRPT
jgi:NAD(P)-dependent dehydrogenase (short-subunit alcohol dehydrogenase family)